MYILASNNPGKARELTGLFAERGLSLLSLADLGFTPGEDGSSFEENAIQKAAETAAFLRGLCLKTKTVGRCPTPRKGTRPLDPCLAAAHGFNKLPALDFCVLADDSGLEIDALGGAPGVDSALFLGADTPYAVRNAYILDKLADVPDAGRTARFVCVVACYKPDGEILTTRAVLEGRITREPRGEGGFGYDPIFYVPKDIPKSIPERGRTLAEMTVEEKNRLSHRGKAMRRMLDKITATLPAVAHKTSCSQKGTD